MVTSDIGAREGRGEARLNRAVLTGRILGLALAMSVVAYILIGTLLSQADFLGPSLSQTRLPLIGVGFAALVGSIMYRRARLAPHRLEAVFWAKGEDGFAGYLLATTAVSAVLAEVAGIAGLLLGILAGDTRSMNVFCVVALVAIVFSLPNARRWREAYSYLASRGQAEPAPTAGPLVPS